MIKGKNQHVIPSVMGWSVIDECSQKVIQHFDTQKEAILYAQRCAQQGEGEVLVHTAPCHSDELSTVRLPQREVLMTDVHQHAPSKSTAQPSGGGQRSRELFDPMLGYDEYYFDI